MRSLLVALDDTPAGAVATDFALSLADRCKAAITGIGILDIDYLTAPSPGGIGSEYYKFKADQARLKAARERNERLVSSFRQKCGARKLAGEVLALEGRPEEELRGAAGVHDLIVIGRDSDFHGNPVSGPESTVAQILKGNPRPLIVTTETLREPSRILVAYDGSIPAARSLQIFALLGLTAACEVHVVSIGPREAETERCVRQATAYLGLYGTKAIGRAVTTATDPAEFMLAEAKSLGMDMLVMGAYGHRGWRETLLGSFTTRLLAHSTMSLFIHH